MAEPETVRLSGIKSREVLPEYEPAGWLVLDPDGHVVASGGQTATEASAGAGGDAQADKD